MSKTTLSLCALAAALLSVTAPNAHAQLKVGTVDMNTIFSQYYKTKDAEASLNDARASAKKELDDRLDTLKKSMDEINKLTQQQDKPELSEKAKADLKKQTDEKVSEARSLDKEISDFRSTREQQLQQQYMRMRKDIVDDIMVVVNDKVKAVGYDLVFDKSGISLGQIPVILYSREDMDFSNDVIGTLNKNAPKTTTKPAAGDQQ
jgi:outer membrane protein